jgi:hypothetical protein
MAAGGSFSGGKEAGCKADHYHPFGAEITNGGAISTLPIRFYDMMLI